MSFTYLLVLLKEPNPNFLLWSAQTYGPSGLVTRQGTEVLARPRKKMRFFGSYSNPILLKSSSNLPKFTKMASVYIYLGRESPGSAQGACVGCPICSYGESCACAPCTSGGPPGDSPGLVRQAWSGGLGET